MNNNESTTVYLGNTRTISNEYLHEYCSKFGLVLDCSRPEENHLIDFTFVRFLNIQSASKFLSISSHILNNGITLDVRPFKEILHTAVPLQVDRKICIENLPSNISTTDIKKYLRAFGTIKQINSNDREYIYIEFESAASRNKLLKGKIKFHRIQDDILKILPLLRPTDIDLHKLNEEQSTSMNDSIYFEREYNLKIREQFNFIENEISELIRQKRESYEQLRKMIQ